MEADGYRLPEFVVISRGGSGTSIRVLPPLSLPAHDLRFVFLVYGFVEPVPSSQVGEEDGGEEGEERRSGEKRDEGQKPDFSR